MHYWLVMPAAGSGSRFGAALPKQYMPLAGRTVLEWALRPFAADARCRQLIVALAAEDHRWDEVARRLGEDSRERITTVTGGARRSDSVRNALAALSGRAEEADWVLVHDAARPCLGDEELERLLARGAAHPVGALLALPAADTLKRARADSQGAPLVESTVERAGLWRALTPQMFRYGALCDGLDAAHAAQRSPTDEAQALEWVGQSALLVEGAATNFKITTPADLALAATVLQSRGSPAYTSEAAP